jgi:hypothetical protein
VRCDAFRWSSSSGWRQRCARLRQAPRTPLRRRRRRLEACRADFDNDGFADLAIGVLLEDIGGVLDAGAVNVLYGTGGGLSGTGNQVFWQGSPGVVGTPEVDDEFGTALVGSDQPTGATTAATAARRPDDAVQP